MRSAVGKARGDEYPDPSNMALRVDEARVAVIGGSLIMIEISAASVSASAVGERCALGRTDNGGGGRRL
jgi:hypothetical protein